MVDEVSELFDDLLKERSYRKTRKPDPSKKKELEKYHRVHYLSKLIAELEAVKVKARALISSDEEYLHVCELLDSVVNRLTYTRLETRIGIQSER
ncbi:MAG: hypothetical protein EAX81_03905 [Candidatus Thorarchaeota archaeon]|nr:hypothetical protein [Candidatus Thorarchaeota archaeon]